MNDIGHWFVIGCLVGFGLGVNTFNLVKYLWGGV
jgi:hypothetical protein